MPTVLTRVILVSLAVLALWLGALSLSQLLLSILDLPQHLRFSIYVHFIGLLIVLCGLLLFGWLARYRAPMDILKSTYLTFSKLLTRTRLEEKSGRTEPLVVKGPYRYVRHPLYSGVLLMAAGLWLVFDYTLLLVTTILLLLWFNFVVAPFEERELTVLFGKAYSDYARNTPRFIPVRFSRKQMKDWRRERDLT